MIIDVYHKLIKILDKRDKQVSSYLLLLILVVSIIEVLGVASIMPFMSIVTNPEIIQSNKILHYIYNLFEFDSSESFLFYFGVGVLIFLVGSSFLRALVVWAVIRYSSYRNYSISSKIVHAYLQQPYSWFLSLNTSNLAANVLQEVSRVINGCLYPLMRIISNVIVALLIIIILIAADPILAISALVILGVFYVSIFKYAGSLLRQKGTVLSHAQQQRLKALTEAFSGIKDVKIGGHENYFLNKFRQPAELHAESAVSVKIWGEIPSFAIQGLIFGGMILTILYMMETKDEFSRAIPILSLYALGIYKLMPALQEIYKQMVDLKYHASALDIVSNDMRLFTEDTSSSTISIDINPLPFHHSILLSDIKFHYADKRDKPTLSIKKLEIKANQTVGFVGGSGAGKTTAADIILGLLIPQNGNIYVDGQKIDNRNLTNWQRSVGYVPQQIYLSDSSIAENIAIGIDTLDINMDKVRKAATTAGIHNFILSDLEQGYQTYVGEMGVRLSGGQRQRIGIARALYNDPDILILDEATSALDNVTEKIIMDAVEEIGHKKTIIIIAHRLSTIRKANNIVLFDHGEILTMGSYEELLDRSNIFREIVDAQSD